MLELTPQTAQNPRETISCSSLYREQGWPALQSWRLCVLLRERLRQDGSAAAAARQAAVPPADLLAERRGDTVDLQFTVPNANTDGTRPANVDARRRVRDSPGRDGDRRRDPQAWDEGGERRREGAARSGPDGRSRRIRRGGRAAGRQRPRSGRRGTRSERSRPRCRPRRSRPATTSGGDPRTPDDVRRRPLLGPRPRRRREPTLPSRITTRGRNGPHRSACPCRWCRRRRAPGTAGDRLRRESRDADVDAGDTRRHGAGAGHRRCPAVDADRRDTSDGRLPRL